MRPFGAGIREQISSGPAIWCRQQRSATRCVPMHGQRLRAMHRRLHGQAIGLKEARRDTLPRRAGARTVTVRPTRRRSPAQRLLWLAALGRWRRWRERHPGKPKRPASRRRAGREQDQQQPRDHQHGKHVCRRNSGVRGQEERRLIDSQRPLTVRVATRLRCRRNLPGNGDRWDAFAGNIEKAHVVVRG